MYGWRWSFIKKKQNIVAQENSNQSFFLHLKYSAERVECNSPAWVSEVQATYFKYFSLVSSVSFSSALPFPSYLFLKLSPLCFNFHLT